MFYLVNAHYAATMSVYRTRQAGAARADQIHILPYEQLPQQSRLSRGTWVFSDFEVSTEAGLCVAASTYNQLVAAGPGLRLLNDPGAFQPRRQLLERLHADGLNRYRAFAANGPLGDVRFPVFVREENAHTGSLTPLLHSPRDLRRALRRLTSPLTGFELHHLLVTEFCDTSNGTGVFRTYGAYRVGDRIIRKGVISSDLWVTKSRHRILDEQALRLERDYALGDEHEAWLQRVFKLSGVEYGRVDYGVHDGRPQLWEINTNPTVSGRKARSDRPPLRLKIAASLRPLFEAGRDRFHAHFGAALDAIDLPADGPPVELRLDPEDVRAMRSQRTVADRRRRNRRRLQRARTAVRQLTGRGRSNEVNHWRIVDPRQPTSVGDTPSSSAT